MRSAIKNSYLEPLATQAALEPWQRHFAEAVKDPSELLRMLQLPDTWLPQARKAALVFPLRVPRGFVNRMRTGDPEDPLLRQVLPLGAELETVPGFGKDPLQENQATVHPGVLHKYQGRVLMVTTGACAVHCRYCFRRHFPYGDSNPAQGDWSASLEYLGANSDVREVILSGGDPLSLPDARLSALALRLEALAHLTRLRIHTRLPVVLPERVTPALLELLARGRLRKVIVLHVNPPAEIDASVREALARLSGTGALLLNQSVLLRGVNDQVAVLERLSEELFSAGVQPYYLHQLDRVAGAAHFLVDDSQALALEAELRQRLPGYLVPRLVRERPGASGKIPLTLDVLGDEPC
ncbi:MAG: EF-P beta-lysylation protein EpmB [Deltaproteobacteria bacterium]|nr:EF-P beta-lysylation protein EpmB [Deltaproteobacteria bacterium]